MNSMWDAEAFGGPSHAVSRHAGDGAGGVGRWVIQRGNSTRMVARSVTPSRTIVWPTPCPAELDDGPREQHPHGFAEPAQR